MRAIIILLALSLSACGFHLRGHDLKGASFPFKSLYFNAAAPTPFVADLKTSLELYNIQLIPTPDKADLTLVIVTEAADKQILALSGAGQVLEYQLRYRVSLRAYDKQMVEWMPADEILLQRTLTYDPAQILAKEQEEALLYRDMRSDAVQQVMRRLSRAKPRPELADTPATESKPAKTSSTAQPSKATPAK